MKNSIALGSYMLKKSILKRKICLSMALSMTGLKCTFNFKNFTACQVFP